MCSHLTGQAGTAPGPGMLYGRLDNRAVSVPFSLVTCGGETPIRADHQVPAGGRIFLEPADLASNAAA